MSNSEVNILANALEALAGALRMLGAADVPHSPESASFGGLPLSDEARAAMMFEGKHIVTLLDVCRVLGWSRGRVKEGLEKRGIKCFHRDNEKQGYEYLALDVWRSLYAGKLDVDQVPDFKNGVDMNVLPLSRKNRKGDVA